MSTSTVILPRLNDVEPLERGRPPSTAPGGRAPCRSGSPSRLACFWSRSGSSDSSSAACASVAAASAEVDVEGQRPRRLLGLDDRLDRQREAGCRAAARCRTRPHMNAPSAAPSGLAPCRRRGTGGRAGRCRCGTAASSKPVRRLAQGDQPVGDPRDVDALDRVDQPEQVEPLLADRADRRARGRGRRSASSPGRPRRCRGADRRGRSRRSGPA